MGRSYGEQFVNVTVPNVYGVTDMILIMLNFLLEISQMNNMTFC